MVSFHLKPSRCLALVLIAAHAATAALIWPLQIDTAAKAVLFILVALSLAHALWRHALLRSPGAIVGGQIFDRETASLLFHDGSSRDAEILGSSYVLPSLTVLNVKAKGRTIAQHALIVRDNIDAEDFRALRVVLRWQSARRA